MPAKHSFNGPRKIYVAIPSGGQWDSKFGMSMARLTRAFSNSKSNVEMLVANVTGSMLGNNRQKLLIDAMKAKCTHILFIDDDMVFKPEMVQWLIAANKSFIAAAGVTKSKTDCHCVAVDLEDEFVDLRTCGPLVEVRSVGLAFALIELEPLKESYPPHFMMEWIPGEGKQCGEDVYFCAKWLELGEKIYVHREASKQLGHVGNYTYTWEDVK